MPKIKLTLTLKFADVASRLEWQSRAHSAGLFPVPNAPDPFPRCACGDCACSEDVASAGDLCPECQDPHESFDELVAREEREAEEYQARRFTFLCGRCTHRFRDPEPKCIAGPKCPSCGAVDGVTQQAGAAEQSPKGASK